MQGGDRRRRASFSAAAIAAPSTETKLDDFAAPAAPQGHSGAASGFAVHHALSGALAFITTVAVSSSKIWPIIPLSISETTRASSSSAIDRLGLASATSSPRVQAAAQPTGAQVHGPAWTGCAPLPVLRLSSTRPWQRRPHLSGSQSAPHWSCATRWRREDVRSAWWRWQRSWWRQRRRRGRGWPGRGGDECIAKGRRRSRA